METNTKLIKSVKFGVSSRLYDAGREGSMHETTPKIGSAGPGYTVYELDIYDFMQPLEPPPEFEMDNVDPVRFFITSGDAIQKVEYIIEFLGEYKGQAESKYSEMEDQNEEMAEFVFDCSEQLECAKKLLDELIYVRGDNVFLETEWIEHKLRCLVKNPRARQRIAD